MFDIAGVLVDCELKRRAHYPHVGFIPDGQIGSHRGFHCRAHLLIVCQPVDVLEGPRKCERGANKRRIGSCGSGWLI